MGGGPRKEEGANFFLFKSLHNLGYLFFIPNLLYIPLTNEYDAHHTVIAFHAVGLMIVMLIGGDP